VESGQSFRALRSDYAVYATKDALHYSLETLLSPQTNECVLFHFRVRYKISIYDDEPVTLEEIKYILKQMFREGGTMFISKFNEKFNELTGQTMAV